MEEVYSKRVNKKIYKDTLFEVLVYKDNLINFLYWELKGEI